MELAVILAIISVVSWCIGLGLLVSVALRGTTFQKRVFGIGILVLLGIAVLDWVITPFIFIPMFTSACAIVSAYTKQNGVSNRKARRHLWWGFVWMGIAFLLLLIAIVLGISSLIGFLTHL